MNSINTYQPDIIVGCETWLTPEIYSSELLPSEYNIFRKDRSDGYGREFIACHNSLISCEISLQSTAELVACAVQQLNKPPLIVFLIYTIPHLQMSYILMIFALPYKNAF